MLKINRFLSATILGLVSSFSMAHFNEPSIANDPTLINALKIENWYPHGKNAGNFNYRGNISYHHSNIAIHPLSNIRLGVFSVQNAVITGQHYFEMRFSNHPHEVHAPFDHTQSGQGGEKIDFADGSQVGYELTWKQTQTHPANGYDGPQGGGYPVPVGAYDTYTTIATGNAVATYYVGSIADKWDNPRTWNPLPNFYENFIETSSKLGTTLRDPERNVLGKIIGEAATAVETASAIGGFVEAVWSPTSAFIQQITEPEALAIRREIANMASIKLIKAQQALSVDNQFQVIAGYEATFNNPVFKDALIVASVLLPAAKSIRIMQEGKALGKFKGYLPKDQLIALKQDVMDFRSGLPSKIKNSGNAASADINIEGLSTNKLLAHSRVNVADLDKGIVGEGSGIFKTQTLPNKIGQLVDRAGDSEAKIFEHLASQLGNNTSARGTVTIMTERPACSSCLGVAKQFRDKYPNIKANIVDNSGNVLKPSRKP